MRPICEAPGVRVESSKSPRPGVGKHRAGRPNPTKILLVIPRPLNRSVRENRDFRLGPDGGQEAITGNYPELPNTLPMK